MKYVTQLINQCCCSNYCGQKSDIQTDANTTTFPLISHPSASTNTFTYIRAGSVLSLVGR